MAKRKREKKTKQLAHQLAGARFRFLNEKLYTMTSEKAVLHFKQNPGDFKRYHEGFSHQVKEWPVNPVDYYAAKLINYGKRLSTVDMDCGEGKLGLVLKDKHTVRSFDLVSLHPHVEVGDMCDLSEKVDTASVDLVIFCLSLMNVNFHQALAEAHRILKPSTGKLWIAEVTSRFTDGTKAFCQALAPLFRLTRMESKNDYFTFFEFERVLNNDNNNNGKNVKKCEKISLAPCLYKKR